MVSRGLWSDLVWTSLHTLSHVSQPEVLPSHNPTRGLNTDITQVLMSVPLLVDYFSLLVSFKFYLTI